ncbi:flagellar hook-associated protein FlgL [Ideonella sp. A 288]|uniref:flagellar hook-associated protein FlgL n=1 Tax=Ideonella sp. A 288 TaxID=1962181 RepID=UPI000B4BEE55|nr:flagellar hook-associated protein FlgL [Ideonella sp. A 288]
MRVSTASRYETTVDSLQRRQADLSEAQMQMASGKRVNRPSDDPTAAARAERAHIAQQRLVAEQRSVDVSRNAMALAEAALGQAGEVMQQARESMVAAGNASYGPGERAAVAKHLQQMRGQLLSLANQHDAAGGYTFGGQGSTSQPFLDAIGGVVFAGTAGQAQVSASEQMPVTVDGENIWLGARSGNGVFVTGAAAANTGKAWVDAGGVTSPGALTGDPYEIVFSDSGGGVMVYDVLQNGAPTAIVGAPYTSGASITVDGMSFDISGTPAAGDVFTLDPAAPGLDVFDALDRAIAVLQDGTSNGGEVSQAVSNGLRDLDGVMGHLQAARSVAGSALSRLDSIDSRNQDRALWAKSVQSDAEDLDMVQAVSDFQNQQTSYQAALQTYAMVQRLSLFDYIK